MQNLAPNYGQSGISQVEFNSLQCLELFRVVIKVGKTKI